MGAYFVLYPRSKIVTLLPFVIIQVVEVPAVFFLGVWLLLQLASGAGSVASAAGEPAGGIALWAHLTGFLAGAAGVRLFRRPERQRVEWWNDV
jgi:membrane associated rhomboid family serine protease